MQDVYYRGKISENSAPPTSLFLASNLPTNFTIARVTANPSPKPFDSAPGTSAYKILNIKGRMDAGMLGPLI